LLAGEDSFLDSLPEPHRRNSWQTVRDRAQQVDCFAAASQYYAELMSERMKLPPDRTRVVYSGINLDGYNPASASPETPVLGYFARLCREKGLPTLVEAFIELKRRDRVKNLKLRVGGGMSPRDEQTLVKGLVEDLKSRGLLHHTEFCPNLTRAQKLDFYRSLSVLSVPALYGEAFGLYLVEAWASGVPVVQPRHAAFPELIQTTQAGVLCEPDDIMALADSIEQLLLDPDRQRRLGQAGRQAAVTQFSMERMAENMAALYKDVVPAAMAAQA
jgi:glycosyltransferase involved in cell wall biosynthesis